MSDTVEVKTTVSFRSWPVPNQAVVDMPPRPKQEGVQALPTIPLTELDDEVVDALVKRWLDNLYANRQQASPYKFVPRDLAPENRKEGL